MGGKRGRKMSGNVMSGKGGEGGGDSREIDKGC